MFNNSLESAFAEAEAVSHNKNEAGASDLYDEPEQPSNPAQIHSPPSSGIPVAPPFKKPYRNDSGRPKTSHKALAAGLVLYDNGRNCLLRGQALPFCDPDNMWWNTEICHVLDLCSVGHGPAPSGRELADLAFDQGETSNNQADGIWGFSGWKYRSRPGLTVPELMKWECLGNAEEELFPACYVDAEHIPEADPVTLIDVQTGEPKELVKLPRSEFLQPFCSSMPLRKPMDWSAMNVGMVSGSHFWQVYLGHGLGPVGHGLDASPEYQRFIARPQRLSDVVKEAVRFKLGLPTFRMDLTEEHVHHGRWRQGLRRRLNANAEDMMGRLTVASGLA